MEMNAEDVRPDFVCPEFILFAFNKMFCKNKHATDKGGVVMATSSKSDSGELAKINMLGICAVVSDFSGQEVIYKSLTHKEQRIVRVMRRAPYRRRGGL
jgi:hypothetical protein